jgi:D-alanine-D-alanine ligase
MHIGLTYDLKAEYLQMGFSSEEVAEFDRVETIEALEETLKSAGHRVTRIGRAEALIARLSQGERWDLVFNIAEGYRGQARESQVPAILDVFGIPYTFSDPMVMAICLDKRLAKHVVREQSVVTPDFAVVSALEDLSKVELGFPVFAKPLAEGTSRGVTAASKIADSARLEAVTRELLGRYAQPVLVEAYLPGREFTVGILGTGDRARTIGAMEIHLEGSEDREVYSYDNKQLFEGRVRYSLATDEVAAASSELALKAYRALGCRDGGRVDVRLDAFGRPSFIEANPLAGLNPDISDLAILGRLNGIAYRDIILEILESASCRLTSDSAAQVRSAVEL